MSAEFLAWLVESAIATSAAILVVSALRAPVRRVFGACACYALWLLVPAAWSATLLPAPVREVIVAEAPRITASATVVAAAAPAFDGAVWMVLVWIAGAAAVAGVGWRRQRAFVRRLGVLTPRADGLLQSRAVIGLPAVVGLRPRIVVPADFDTRYRPDERMLILSHERIHVRRGDVAVQALSFAFRCVYWFNPLAWFAAERVRRDQELACDASVVARYPDARRVYGEAMVKITLGYDPAPLACHWGPAHPLKERIRMLKQTTPTTRTTLAASLALILLTAGSGYAAWALRQPQIEVKAASAAVGHDRSTDPAGAGNGITLRVDKMPLSDAARRIADLGKIRLVNGDALSARPISFDFKQIRPQTALQILVQDDGKALLIEAGQARVVASTHAGAATAATAEAAAAAAAVTRPASVDVRTQRPPRYPVSAAANRQSGLVVVIVDVTPDGRVRRATIEKSVPAGVFDQSTLDAVKQWTFQPAIKDGKPVAGRLRVPVQYDLDEDDAAGPVAASAA